MSGHDVQCVGGPLDGKVFPPEVIPWRLWVPRGEDNVPLGALPPHEALRTGHYRYAGIRLGRALHVYQHPDDMPNLTGFLDGITLDRRLDVPVDRATLTRLRAHIAAVEEDEPGLGRAPGESEDEALRIAIMALVDRGLTEGESDRGVVAHRMTGAITPMTFGAKLTTRLQRALHVLRKGW